MKLSVCLLIFFILFSLVHSTEVVVEKKELGKKFPGECDACKKKIQQFP